MIVDGNRINEEIKNGLRGKSSGLSLAIVWVGDDPVSAKYIEKKKKFGEEIGVGVDLFKYGSDIFTGELMDEIKNILRRDYSGIIVQLPLPRQIDSTMVLNSIPIDKDIDLLSDNAYRNFVEGKSKILPPVVASVKEIFDRSGVGKIQGMHAIVIGRGRLVGRPVAAWLINQGASVKIIGKEDWVDSANSPAGELATADIIVSGAGVPGIIKPDMVKDGAMIIDVATSDVAGSIVGDVDPAVADKVHIFSPVPGGVGPITVAMLFKNLVILNS